MIVSKLWRACKSKAAIAVYTLCFQECKKSGEMQKVQLRSANICQVSEGILVSGKGSRSWFQGQ